MTLLPHELRRTIDALHNLRDYGPQYDDPSNCVCSCHDPSSDGGDDCDTTLGKLTAEEEEALRVALEVLEKAYADAVR